jgi:hypothetical protein
VTTEGTRILPRALEGQPEELRPSDPEHDFLTWDPDAEPAPVSETANEDIDEGADEAGSAAESWTLEQGAGANAPYSTEEATQPVAEGPDLTMWHGEEDDPEPMQVRSGEGGLSYFDLAAAEFLWSVGQGRHEKPGTFVIFSHGIESSLVVEEFAGYDAKEVAAWIRAQPGYVEGQPVQLNACHAGVEGGVAQNVSKELNAQVSGPVDYLYVLGDVEGDHLNPWNVYAKGRLVGH